MARVLPGFLRYRVYRRLMASYLILAIATIAALSVTLYSLFSASALGEISQNSQVLLERTAVAADILNDEVATIGGHLVNEIDVISYLFSKRDDKMLDFRAMRVLDKITSVYTFIRSIGLYNGATGGYYNNVGMVSRIPPGDFTRSPAGFIPRIIPAEASPDQKPHAVLTRMIFPYAAAAGPSSSAIELNIDERYLQSVIRSLSGHAEGAVTMVLDPRGMVLSHADAGLFMADISARPFVRRIIASPRTGGSFMDTLDGEKRLVTFVKSERSGWAFVLTQRYSTLIGNIDRLKIITLLVALGLAILGTVLSMLMTLMLHNPLRHIVEGVATRERQGLAPVGAHEPPDGALDEYALIADTLTRYDHDADELRRSLRASLPLMREAWVQGLLAGESREGLIPDRTLAELDTGMAGPPYAVAVLRIDSFEEFCGAGNPGSQEAARRGAARAAQEILNRFHPSDAVVMAEDEIALLACVAADPSMDSLVLAFTELHRDLQARSGLSFTVGIGDLAYAAKEIHRSYASAAERCRYRLFLGPGSIIDERAIHARRTALSRYPKDVEERVLETLRHGNAESIRAGVEDFVGELSGLSFYQFITFIDRLVLAVFWHFGESTELLDVNYRDHDRLLRDIESAETCAGLARKITDFCCTVSALIGGQSNRAHVKRNERIAEDVKKAVAERYAEPGLSLDIMADIVGLSPGYLARLFKLVVGQSFGDYLNGVRLTKARELLTATRMSAQAIGESVGIYSAPYFSTLFKKSYGLSPSRYRERTKAL
jgi:two-component system, response regulator YesN